MPLQENAMLGPYRIVRMLGEGGMGAVYRAKDTRLGRDVAIKVLTAASLSDHERLARFEQEARATGMLNHPNLLTIFDVGHTEDTPFLVSELLEGETLRDRIARGPLPPRKVIDVASQMAEGLAAAHEKGIIHRDLKPENIFVTREGRVKILDFGIAKLSAKAGADGPTFQMAATEPGMVLGTVGYMSPEQVRGEVIDARSDIFAFGTIVYEMLTGARAFKRNSAIETLSAILKEEPPDLAEALPHLPPPLEKLVRRCLEKDRDHRFQTSRDLAFNLETLSTYSSSRTLTGTPLPQNATASQAPTTVARAGSPAHPPARTSATSAVRPRTTAMPAHKPKRRVSPLLLALLYLASVAGAVWGTWWYAHRGAGEIPEVAFRRMTFRRGEVRGARFSPDGETIVYSAAWDGRPTETFIATRQSPEARPLGVADVEVLSVARSTELAVLLHRDRQTNAGILGRVPLAGGSPREVAEGVVDADWSPDGQNLAIIRIGPGKSSVEYPIGTVRYETPHALQQLRVSPDGKRAAFIEPETDAIEIAVLDLGGGKPTTIARGFERGVNGIAWAPDGKEVWITGTATAAPPSLWAINVDTTDKHLVSRLTGSMKLYDISTAGRALLSTGMWRAALAYQPPGETAERDASWLDWSRLADLSPDGKTILFNETREGGGAKSGVYLRHAGEPMPVRIADGIGDALSPDGKYVLCHQGKKLVLVPTGTGEARELKIGGAFDGGAAWMPDSKRVVLAGVKDKGYQLHVLDTLDETATPISPDIWGDALRPFAVSPDGTAVAGMTAQRTIAIYPVDRKTPPAPVAGTQSGEIPVQWSADGTALFVYRPEAIPAQVTKIILATGAREPWKQFMPADPAGVYRIAPVCITPNASAYAYNALRTTSDLYVAEGLR
jgi:serine/threonine protein kinase/Tol biopolymer transport system component